MKQLHSQAIYPNKNVYFKARNGKYIVLYLTIKFHFDVLILTKYSVNEIPVD